MSRQLQLLIYLFLLIKPSALCKYFNNTCYKLFFSDNNSEHIKKQLNGSIITENNNTTNGTYKCIESGFEKICSGHGICSNGICHCDRLESVENETESPYEYSGKYCEECPYCKGQRCEKLLPCLECILQASNCTSKCYIHYNLVDKVNKYLYNDKMCEVEDKSGCRFRFKYFYNQTSDIFVDMEKEKRCLNGSRYLLCCCYAFVIYIVSLMVIFKRCL